MFFCKSPLANVKTVTTGRQSISPTMFLIAKDVIGVLDPSIPTNILIGFSTAGDIYAASFPSTNFIYQSINSGYWSSYLLASNFTTYAHLKGTSLIVI